MNEPDKAASPCPLCSATSKTMRRWFSEEKLLMLALLAGFCMGDDVSGMGPRILCAPHRERFDRVLPTARASFRAALDTVRAGDD